MDPLPSEQPADDTLRSRLDTCMHRQGILQANSFHDSRTTAVQVAFEPTARLRVANEAHGEPIDMSQTINRVPHLLVAVIALVAVGCSAKLTNDVRIPITRLFVIEKTVSSTGTQAGGPVDCGSSVVHEFKQLPSDEFYGLNIKGGEFASNEFSVTFHESGALKQVTLNSDPQIDETISATASLVKELGAAIPSAGVAAAAACPKPVSTKTKVECALPFSEFVSNGYKCR
jgi:hypothetical protein